MRPYDSVILTEDLSEALPAGTQGAIVETYAQTDDVFIVELFDRDGTTLDVVDVRADQMTVTLADFFEGERIALLTDLPGGKPGHRVKRGQVGTIIGRVGVGLYRVAFADETGMTHATALVHAGQMMLLHWQPTAES